jgi:hypothetical protein
MPSFKVHCDECEYTLGNPFPDVHHWLDEFAREYYPSPVHRAIRHHREGIEQVRLKWGNDAAEAARLHIQADMGFIPDKSYWEDMTEVIAHPTKGRLEVPVMELLKRVHRDL